MVFSKTEEMAEKGKARSAQVGKYPFDMILKSGKNTHSHSNSFSTLLVIKMGKDVDWSHSLACGYLVLCTIFFSFLSSNCPGTIVKSVHTDSLFLNSKF